MPTSTKGAAMIPSTELSNAELSEVQGGRLETCIPMPLPEPFPLPWPGDGFPSRRSRPLPHRLGLSGPPALDAAHVERLSRVRPRY